MTSAIALIIFGAGLVGIGVFLYIFRKNFFHIPDYKSPKYGISIWYYDTKVTGIERLDETMDYLIDCMNEEFPGLSKEVIGSKLSILKIAFCDDTNDSLYVSIGTEGMNITKNTKYKVMDDGLYVLCNGVARGNNIWLRRLGNGDAIKESALIHEVVHYLLDSFGIENNGDSTHSNKIYWESGWIQTVLSKLH